MNVLAGKIAVVTGANRGIGHAIALALAEAGADIVGTSRQMSDEEAIAKEVRALGQKFFPFACDMKNRAESTALAKKVLTEVGQVDILVNNAGTIRRENIADYSLADWDEVVEVNLTAPFILTQDFGKPMLERGAGKVIFISSLLSYQGGIRVPAYTASKSGIAGLVKAFANEWAGKGVNVNAVAPGYIVTDNTEALRADPIRYEAITGRIPAGRWGEGSDIAGSVVFLASENADYLHGSTITVDGGWMGR
ncbi:2-deoxy-D-gluconate 3-dehydrogenase [Actinomycetes bacterium]|nr:2-deoxy-D-gluconate 3-dehydrogenase [Actinomycetes bacterium]